MLKHLGLISIVLMWLGTYALLRHHMPDLGKTISRHASRSVRYHVTYGILEVTVVSMFSLFMFRWFIPHFGLDGRYELAAALGLIGTVVAAVIPDRDGWQNKIHAVAAYGMAASLLVMNILLVQRPEIDTVTRIVLYLTLIYMISGAVVTSFRPAIYRKNALKYQIAYFLAYQIPIVLAVYL